MKGYIYSMYQGADPGVGWRLNDPIFGSKPTLGACVPNIRRTVQIGDWIFVISGRVKAQQQYVVGGFRVAEKIDQLAAAARFPEQMVRKGDDGQLEGNVIVNPDGSRRADDQHTSFERRLENFIVGDQPMLVEGLEAIARARAETLPALTRIFGKDGNRPFDNIGRDRRMD